MLAFAPMFFMTGTLGAFVYVIPLVVMLGLTISFAEVMLAKGGDDETEFVERFDRHERLRRAVIELAARTPDDD